MSFLRRACESYLGSWHLAFRFLGRWPDYNRGRSHENFMREKSRRVGLGLDARHSDAPARGRIFSRGFWGFRAADGSTTPEASAPVGYLRVVTSMPADEIKAEVASVAKSLSPRLERVISVRILSKLVFLQMKTYRMVI